MPEAVLTEEELWGLTDAVAAVDVDFNLLDKGIAVAVEEEGVDWRRGTAEEERVLLEKSVDLDVLLAGAVLPRLVGTCDLKVELDRAVLLLVLLDSLGAGNEEAFDNVGAGIEEDFALGAEEEEVLAKGVGIEEEVLAKGVGIEEGPLLELIVGELVTLVPLLAVLVGALDFKFFALILSDNSFARARARALDSNALLLTGELVDHIFFFVVVNNKII
jgi:hypothetical protein